MLRFTAEGFVYNGRMFVSATLAQAGVPNPIECAIDVRGELDGNGFARVQAQDLTVSADLAEDLERLISSFDDLPPDPYDRAESRRRRLTIYAFLPWCGVMEALPASTYEQSHNHNRENGDIKRVFVRLERDVERDNSFLRSLIEWDFANLRFSEAVLNQPLLIGVHQVRMVARPGRPGTVSPNELHKDGEPFTWVHLFGRDRVRGGETLVTDNDRRELARFTLENTLDSFVLDDTRVYHHASAIEVETPFPTGYRDTILVDFTPLKRERVEAPKRA